MIKSNHTGSFSQNQPNEMLPQITGYAIKIWTELFQPPSQKNSETNDTLVESPNRTFRIMKETGHGIILRVATPP